MEVGGLGCRACAWNCCLTACSTATFGTHSAFQGVSFPTHAPSPQNSASYHSAIYILVPPPTLVGVIGHRQGGSDKVAGSHDWNAAKSSTKMEAYAVRPKRCVLLGDIEHKNSVKSTNDCVTV